MVGDINSGKSSCLNMFATAIRKSDKLVFIYRVSPCLRINSATRTVNIYLYLIFAKLFIKISIFFQSELTGKNFVNCVF